MLVSNDASTGSPPPPPSLRHPLKSSPPSNHTRRYKIDKEDKDAKKAAKKGDGEATAGEASEAGLGKQSIGEKLADKVHVVKGKTPAVAPKPSHKKVDGKGVSVLS